MHKYIPQPKEEISRHQIYFDKVMNLPCIRGFAEGNNDSGIWGRKIFKQAQINNVYLVELNTSIPAATRPAETRAMFLHLCVLGGGSATASMLLSSPSLRGPRLCRAY